MNFTPNDAVRDYAKDKGREVLVHFFTVAADMILLVIWVVGEFCFEHLVVPRFPAETSVARVTLWMFRVIFAVSTLIPTISNVYKHVRIQCIRNGAAINAVKEELTIKGMTPSAVTREGHQ